jgi:hypothetical protein
MIATKFGPEIEPPVTSAPSWVNSFRRIQTYLDALPSNSVTEYSIAGNAVRLQFGSERFREKVAPAFRHLECAESSKGALKVLLHDLATAPGTADFLEALSLHGRETDIWLLDTPELMLIVQKQGQLVTAVDWRLNRAYWLVADAASIPYIEKAAPLRLLLGYWLGTRECYLVHAALVGNEQGGVLLVGHSGAGKSTTALACLDAGLGYASDDHCLVSVNGSAYGHSIFGTGKLDFSEMGRFPSLVPAAELSGRGTEEKVVFFLDRLQDHRMSSTFPLRAILLPHISGSTHTLLREMNAAAAFKAIAPSCALHFPAARPRALRCFNELVRQVPAYVLELGSDVPSVPIAIRELLAQPPIAKGVNNGFKTR